MTHETTWKDDLLKGYREFRAGDFKEQKALYENVGRHGQSPRVMLLSCADSRVDPTDIFNAYPGEMFVIRNVANMCPPIQSQEGHHGTISALEFGVKALGVEVIVVMGHESCGGAAGCLHGLGDLETDYLKSWVQLLEPAKRIVVAAGGGEREMELETVRLSIRNLMTYDFIADRVERGELALQGAYFSIISAKLLMETDGEFVEVEV